MKRTQVLLGCLFTCLCLLLAPLSVVSPFLKKIDGYFYDELVKINMYRSNWPPPVIIVDIDDLSMQEQGRWPWSRDLMAHLLEGISNAGAITVAFDLIFSDIQKNAAHLLDRTIKKLQQITPVDKTSISRLLDQLAPMIDNDQYFSSVLSESDTILGYLFHGGDKFSKGSLPAPLMDANHHEIDASNLSVHEFGGYYGVVEPFLVAAKHAGFTTNIPDEDGVIRRTILLSKFHNKLYSSLALTAIMRYLIADTVTLSIDERQGKKILTGLDVGGIKIPIDEKGYMMIPFFGKGHTSTYLSATDILNHRVSLDAMAGSIVVVGSSSTLLADIHSTPVSQVFPGVEMNTNIITGILNQLIIKWIDWPKDYYYWMWLMLFPAILLPYLGVLSLGILYFFIMAGLLGGMDWIFVVKQHFIPMSLPTIMLSLQMAFNVFYDVIFERRQRKYLQGLFGQYVPPTHIQMMLESDETVSMAGETREMTVFFSDIRSFTTISESLPAQKIKQLLNEFFTPITQIIFEHNGTIDKYVGDMVIAFWGAPLTDESHAENAIEAVLKIKEKMFEIGTHLAALSLPQVAIGMGLNTGLMNVGDMGSVYRKAYTVLGDSVNLASRLEALTKFYGVDILVSETTRQNQDKYLWRLIDKVAVKGRQAAVSIYEPLGVLTMVDKELIDEVDSYHQALSLYYASAWDDAYSAFEKLHQRFPESILYALYLERVVKYREIGVGDDWDGAYVHTNKYTQ